MVTTQMVVRSSPSAIARTYRSSWTAVEGTPRGSIISTPIGGVITASATFAEIDTDYSSSVGAGTVSHDAPSMNNPTTLLNFSVREGTLQELVHRYIYRAPHRSGVDSTAMGR